MLNSPSSPLPLRWPLTFGLFIHTFAFGQEIHGPICSWHLDPTSTMNIQWIEKVNATVDENQWYTGNAGFGYADNDDSTPLDMQGKHRVLYLRREFELKSAPGERPISVFGGWTATLKGEQGDPVSHRVDVTYDFRQRSTNATATQGDREVEMTKVESTGRLVEMDYAWTVHGKKRQLKVSARAPEGEDKKLLGTWIAVDGEGKTLEEGEWTAELTNPPQFGGRRGGGRRGGGRGDAGDPELKLVLRARYDDGFIAYLNGVEIVRANVGSGAGAQAKGISGHDATDEEEFVVEEAKLTKLLRSGKNILAIEGHNNALDSSDFTLDPTFGYEAFGRYQEVVGDGEAWQYLLGTPQANWKTSEIEAKAPDAIPSNASTYVLRYGERGRSLDSALRTERRLFADTGNVIHQALLTGLKPGTTYAFELDREGASEAFPERRFFRTAPAKFLRPLSFVTGGDMYHTREKLDAMNSEAGRHEVSFALLGGDLAYANGRDAKRWYEWVDSWARFAVTPEDLSIPMIAVIGNHECNGNLNEVAEADRGEFDPLKRAKFYYSLFPLPEKKSNFVIDFGNYMSVVCLDSYHTQTVESQTSWLEETLKQRSSLPNLFVCYHRPTFGTLVKDDIEEIRQQWVPLFEKYGVDAAFENDHHVYKRTLPIINGKFDPNGVVYMGDGSWGVDVRTIPWDRARRLEYIVRAASENHLIRVTLEDQFQRYDTYSAAGIPLDNYLRMRPRGGNFQAASAK